MIQTYEYDLSGNLIRLEETSSGGSLPSRVLECEYDGANRLVLESDQRGSDPAVVTEYEYDAADNRVSKVVSGGPEAGTTSYEIGADNELLSLTRPDSSVVSYGYDATGARIGRSDDGRTDTYEYDTWNRLLSLDLETPSDPGQRGEFDYSYDARTRRMWRQELGDGTVLSFVGGVSVQEYGVGTTTPPPAPPSGSPAVEYVRGPDMGGGVGGMLYSVRGGVGSLVHSSARGDVIERRDEDGTVSWQAQYEAFGKHPVESGSNPDRQRANSKEEDPTGLLNEGFRYRDIETGTFITRDPIGFKDGPNLYTYVHQNPWTHFDPEGLEENGNSRDQILRRLGYRDCDVTSAKRISKDREKEEFSLRSEYRAAAKDADKLGLLHPVDTMTKVNMYLLDAMMLVGLPEMRLARFGSVATERALVRGGVELSESALKRGLSREFSAGGRYSGGADPGPVSWEGGKPFYNPKNYKMAIDPRATGIDRVGLLAHEKKHLAQFQSQPWKVWWSQSALPGSSIAMWRLERQAYKAQATAMGTPYKLFRPLSSDNTHHAIIKDSVWAGAIIAGGYLTHKLVQEHQEK